MIMQDNAMSYENGKSDSDSENLGSNPSSPAKENLTNPQVIPIGQSGHIGQTAHNGRTRVGTEAEYARRREIVGIVYFMTCDAPDYPIKIGFSMDPKVRIQSMRTSSPYRFIVLATIEGTRRTERRMLQAFKAQRLRGEWFSRSPALMEAIERAKAGKYPLDVVEPIEDDHGQIRREFDEYRKSGGPVVLDD